MISLSKPELFKPKFEVVGCYLEHGGTFLLLHRQDHKPQGGTWDIPGGKIHAGESVLDAVEREIREETGCVVAKSAIIFFNTYYVKYPEFDFTYHVFHHTLADKPHITPNTDEHSEYRWVTPRQALTMSLIPDEDFCLKSYFKDALQ